MIANGNSFSFTGQLANGSSYGVQDPESAFRLGDRLLWGWTGFQSVGNTL